MKRLTRLREMAEWHNIPPIKQLEIRLERSLSWGEIYQLQMEYKKLTGYWYIFKKTKEGN